MRGRAVLVKALLGALALVLAPAAGASVVEKRSVEELAKDSELVVRGHVLSTEGRRSPDGARLFTVVTVETAESLRGTAPSTVTLHVPGGTYGGYGQLVHGAPTFSVGEEVVVFLKRPGKRPDPARAGSSLPAAALEAVPFRVEGMAQGKLTVRVDPKLGTVALPDLSGLEFVEPGAAEPVKAPPAAPLRLDELRARVRAVAP